MTLQVRVNLYREDNLTELGIIGLGRMGANRSEVRRFWGLQEGYCLMVGGAVSDVQRLPPIFESLAPSADRGWAQVGPPGAGHFVKKQ